MSDYLQQEMLGLSIPKRPYELENKSDSRIIPFISMINVKEPLGYKVHKEIKTFSKHKILSNNEKSNIKFIKTAQFAFKQKQKERENNFKLINKAYFKSNDLEKRQLFNNSVPKNRSKLDSYHKWFQNAFSKDKIPSTCTAANANKQISDKKIYFNYGIDKFFKTSTLKSKLFHNNINTNLKKYEYNTLAYKSKEDDMLKQHENRKTNTDNKEAEEECKEDKENEELVKFANDLNFEQYIKETNIKEALKLIKYKAELIDQQNGTPEENKENQFSDEDFANYERMINDYFTNNINPQSSKIILPPIRHYVNQLEIDNNEVEQYRLAFDLLKRINSLKTVHSTLSIIKLLQREGITLPKLPSTKSNLPEIKNLITSSKINNGKPEFL